MTVYSNNVHKCLHNKMWQLCRNKSAGDLFWLNSNSAHVAILQLGECTFINIVYALPAFQCVHSELNRCMPITMRGDG